MSTITQGTRTGLLLRLPSVLPDVKLFLLALDETGDIQAAEDIVGRPVPSAMYGWLKEKGLLDADGAVSWEGIEAFAQAPSPRHSA